MDQAINMYKKVKLYDQMIRMVTQYRKENLIQVGQDGLNLGRLVTQLHKGELILVGQDDGCRAT